MSAEQAVTLAESGKRLQAIQFNGIHAVVSLADAEKLDGAGMFFAWLYRHNGTICSIPNGND